MMRLYSLPLVLTTLLSACQTQPYTYYKYERLLTARKRAAYLSKHVNWWINAQGIAKAAPDEIANAQTTEIPINKNKAVFPDGARFIVFTMGNLQRVIRGDPSGPKTTTSYYTLKNVRSGKVEARIQSRLFPELLTDSGFGGYKQKVWVSRTGHQAIIYEAWHAGDGTHAITALLSASPDGSSWCVKYLLLPSFAPDAFPGGEFEPHGVPYGFFEDMLLFDPMLISPDDSKTIYKKPFNEIKGTGGPLPPFTIG